MSDTLLLCEEKHKNIDEKLAVHDHRLDLHGERLDKLENASVRTETVIQNLCAQLKALTTALWWFIGLALATGVGFIIWYIQSH